MRWIVVEKGTGLPDPATDDALPMGARITHDTPSVRVIELSAEPGEAPVGAAAATVWGWAVTCLTWLLCARVCRRFRGLRRGEGAGTVPAMNPGVGSAASFVVGVVLALFAILGGVSAVTPDANPAAASDDVVRYDAP